MAKKLKIASMFKLYCYKYVFLAFTLLLQPATNLIIYNPYCLLGIGQCSMSCEHATLSSQYPIYLYISTQKLIAWTKVLRLTKRKHFVTRQCTQS